MNKTIRALLMGYVLFDVNGQRFLRYNSALSARKAIHGNVEFIGFNVFLMGWRCFFKRIGCAL